LQNHFSVDPIYHWGRFNYSVILETHQLNSILEWKNPAQLETQKCMPKVTLNVQKEKKISSKLNRFFSKWIIKNALLIHNKYGHNKASSSSRRVHTIFLT